jgi:uncharacterized protein (UPF0276 family)
VSRVSVGLGVRDAYVEPLAALAERGALDVLEVMIDDGLDLGARLAAWRRLGAKWPLVAHGTELGIAGAHGPDDAYLRRVARALDEVRAHWYSEHLAFVRTPDAALGHFAPMGSSDDELAVLRENAARLRARVRTPLLLENPSDILGWESEAGGRALGERYARALYAAHAGALLDLTNLVIDARNDGWSAPHFLDGMDVGRVVEIHLAGGRVDGALHIDSHDHDVDEEALALVSYVAARAPDLRAVIIERDERLPKLDHLLAEVARVRAVLARGGRA